MPFTMDISSVAYSFGSLTLTEEKWKHSRITEQNYDSGFVETDGETIFPKSSCAFRDRKSSVQLPHCKEIMMNEGCGEPAKSATIRCLFINQANLALGWYMQDEDGDNDLLIALAHTDSTYHRQVAAVLTDNAPHSKLLDLRNKYGLCAIIIAAMYADAPAIRRLRLAGADPNVSDYLGNTAAHYAASHGHYGALLALATDISPDEVQHYGATLQRDILAVNLNARNCDGKTPLHLAVERRQTKIIDTLRCVRVDVDANLGENSGGRTALHTAVEHGFLDCVVQLVKMDAIDVNARNYADCTPLDVLAANTSLEDDQRQKIETCLIEHNAVHSRVSDEEELIDDEMDCFFSTF